MSSSLCTFAALAGAAGWPGRRADQKGTNKRAVAQPLAAGAVTEAPPAVVAPPARPVVTAPRRRGGRTGDAGADQLVAWKSIRQERWEGELKVEGKLPLWLVGDLLLPLNHLHTYIILEKQNLHRSTLCMLPSCGKILHSILLQLTY
jgi:carlactone synthase/all-trans-10'-apo-beta-carotenal 13,14-cleaving dioxygenase